jgi:hypothetical protein
MNLLEIFAHDIDAKVTLDKQNAFVAEFVVNNTKYRFTAREDNWEDETSSWDVDFGILHQDRSVEFKQKKSESPFKVFSGVFQCIKLLLDKHPEITQLVFTADKTETSRGKLYDRILSRSIPGWVGRKEEGGFRDFYILTKQ